MEGAFSLDTPVPPLSVLGGVQLGFRGAPRSAWTLDAGITRNVMGKFRAQDEQDYDVLRVHLMAGFKFGFIDRKSNISAKSNEQGAERNGQ
jgi:hypothetical protein